MYQSIVLYITLHYIYGYKINRLTNIIYWFSIIGITLGVMSLVIVISIMNGFEKNFENNFLKFIPHAIITTKYGYIDPKINNIAIANRIPDVIHVAPVVIEDVILQSRHNIAVGMMLGVNSSDPEPLFNYLIQVKPNNLIADKYQVILGYELAAKLMVHYGDVLRLIVPSVNQFTLIGYIPSQRLFTVAGIFITNSEADNYQLLVNQQDASHLIYFVKNYITGWRLWLHHPLTISHINIQKISKYLVWHDWREQKGELFQAIHIEKNMMILLLSLIIIVASFNIISIISLLVMEKQTEIAIFLTYGLTRYKIMLIFILQGISISICGSLLGASLGIFIVTKLNYLIPLNIISKDIALLPVLIKPMQIIIIIFSSILLTLLSTIYPSWYASTTQPIKVLRND